MPVLIKRITVAASLFILLGVVYWRLLLFPSHFVWFDHYDLCQLEIPRLQFFARSLHQGQIPLWNPYLWAGQPVLGSGQPGLLNPLVFLSARFLPLVDGGLSFAELNWIYILLHWLAALFAYRFCRYLSASTLASMLGAVAFSSTGFMGSAPWLDMASGVAPTPLIFWFAFRLWEEDRVLKNAIPLGLALGLAWWTGHHEIPLIDAFAVAIGTLSAAASKFLRERKLSAPVLLGGTLALAIAICVSAIQTLPFYEFGRLSKRWVGGGEPLGWVDKVPYEVHARYSLPWSGILGFLAPGGAPEPSWMLFTGLTIFVLAVIALVNKRSDHRVRWLGYLWLGSLIYALGSRTPLHRLFYALVPLAEKARTPSRGIFLAGFAISALAAVGADLVSKSLVSRRAVWLVAAAGAILAGVTAAHVLPETLPPIHAPYLAIGVGTAVVLTIMISFGKLLRPRIGAAVLLGLVLIETSTVTALRIIDVRSGNAVCATSLTKFQPLAAALQKTGDGRTLTDYNALMTDLGDLYGLDVLISFVAAVPEDILRLDRESIRTQQLLGVTHRIVNGIAVPQTGGLPRAWVVHRAKTVRDDAELRRTIDDPSIDLRTTALSLGPVPPLEQCSDPGEVSFRRPRSDEIDVHAALGCGGLLVVSDTFYPGWTAFVDGKQTPIYEVFGALRGIVAGPGDHRVRMLYRPAIVMYGAALSLSILVICFCWIIKTSLGSSR